MNKKMIILKCNIFAFDSPFESWFNVIFWNLHDKKVLKGGINNPKFCLYNYFLNLYPLFNALESF